MREITTKEGIKMKYAVIDWQTMSRRSEWGECPVLRYTVVKLSTADVPEYAIVDTFYHATDAKELADNLNARK